MSAADRYSEWDAAYVLGALSPDERAEYEQHLKTLVSRGQTGEAKGAAIPNPVGEPGNTSEGDPEPAAAQQGGTR